MECSWTKPAISTVLDGAECGLETPLVIILEPSLPRNRLQIVPGEMMIGKGLYITAQTSLYKIRTNIPGVEVS